MQGTKEGKSPCGLSVTATDFYVYVRNVSAYMCIVGRKEGNKPCRLPNTNTYFCGYVRDTEFSAYVEGKKEGDNFSIIDSCLYVSTDLLFHPWPFSFSLFWNSLCFNLRVSFYIVKYFL